VVVVPQDEIHDVCLAVEQAEQTHPKHDARVAVPGCTARSAVARTRRHVTRRAPGGSILRRALGLAAAADAWRPRHSMHFGVFPRKLAGQANSALNSAHTRCGIVPRGAVGSDSSSQA
jgi:hypothetical protein